MTTAPNSPHEAAPAAPPDTADTAAGADFPPAVARVRDILRQVIDPEVGVNIVDLGLVYRVEASPQRVAVEMTMTSPACPMGEMILDDVHTALGAALPEGCAVDVALVWEPPWDPSMMAAHTKLHFGWQAEIDPE